VRKTFQRVVYDPTFRRKPNESPRQLHIVHGQNANPIAGSLLDPKTHHQHPFDKAQSSCFNAQHDDKHWLH